MQRELIICSQREQNNAPAYNCVLEMEDALARGFDGHIHVLGKPIKTDPSDKVFIFCTISSPQQAIARQLAELRGRGAITIVYHFDSWNVHEVMISRKNILKRLIGQYLMPSDYCDVYCVTLSEVLNLIPTSEIEAFRYLPLAVDTTLVDGLSTERQDMIFAYGRQPPDITRACSEYFNSIQSSSIFIHTDHTQLKGVNNYLQHRKQFWKTAQKSKIALAYDVMHSELNRFKKSIVGQRWFECWAAGCVVVGKRPTTPDMDQIAKWENPTLEAPDDPADMVKFLVSLMKDDKQLSTMRERNVFHVRSHHDWKVRMSPLLAEYGVQ